MHRSNFAYLSHMIPVKYGIEGTNIIIIKAWQVTEFRIHKYIKNLDSKVHGANMGPTWVLRALDGPHVGPMNLVIRVCIDL